MGMRHLHHKSAYVYLILKYSPATIASNSCITMSNHGLADFLKYTWILTDICSTSNSCNLPRSILESKSVTPTTFVSSPQTKKGLCCLNQKSKVARKLLHLTQSMVKHHQTYFHRFINILFKKKSQFVVFVATHFLLLF